MKLFSFGALAAVLALSIAAAQAPSTPTKPNSDSPSPLNLPGGVTQPTGGSH